jgi:diaminopimelate decarboxylase
VRPIVEAVVTLEAHTGPGVQSWLSFKTHPVPQLMSWWIGTGRGVEVVSETEFATAQRLRCPADQLLVNGVGKQSWLIGHPIPRLRVHFDSAGEIDALLPTALACEWRVGVRVHAPDERDARDERFGGQFGMTPPEAVASLRRLRDAGADTQSVHFHLGQRPQAPDAYRRGVEALAQVCEAASFRPRFVDLGGGLPTGADADAALAGLRSAIDVARARFSPELEAIWLENGRFVTEHSSVLAVRVIDAKDRPEGRYLICDGGRTNQALAADKGVHPILTIPERSGAPRVTTVCGPTCMTDDSLGRVQLPDTVAPGDLLAWMHAGAYHLPWETRFSQGLCAVAWCDEDDQLSLARNREQPDEWVESWNL